MVRSLISQLITEHIVGSGFLRLYFGTRECGAYLERIIMVLKKATRYAPGGTKARVPQEPSAQPTRHLLSLAPPPAPALPASRFFLMSLLIAPCRRLGALPVILLQLRQTAWQREELQDARREAQGPCGLQGASRCVILGAGARGGARGRFGHVLLLCGVLGRTPVRDPIPMATSCSSLGEEGAVPSLPAGAPPPLLPSSWVQVLPWQNG